MVIFYHLKIYHLNLFTTLTVTSTVLILAVCRTPVTHDLCYSATARCSENRGFDSCRGLRFRANKNGFIISNYEQILLMCPVVSAYRIEVHVKYGRELLLNARKWSPSLVSMVINDISVGREKVITSISIPLGGPDNLSFSILLVGEVTCYRSNMQQNITCVLGLQFFRGQGVSPLHTANLTLYWVSCMDLF